MEYGLPKSVEIGGTKFEIRYDFRVILEIFEALNDPEMTERERAYVVLQMFYVDFESISDYNAALKELFRFTNRGELEDSAKRPPKLVSWEQDFQYIVAPINKVLGCETRAIEYDIESNTGGVHWWTFLAGYMEIGDCFFAQVVRIRDKKAKGKKLDKSEQEFYRKNRDLVDIKTKYSDAENELLKAWTGG